MYDQFRKDVFSVLVGVAIGFSVMALCGFMRTFDPKPQQPSVPSQIPPKCDGRCNPARISRPFNVVCPYCRNALSVQPPDVGSVSGKVFGSSDKSK